MTETVRILLVEDDEDDALLTRTFLAESCEVDHAPTAAAAYELLATHTYDLLLVDYRLGTEDGLDFLRQARALGVATPAIFLTGLGDEEVAVAAMKAGAIDYLLKSKLSAASLSSAIRHGVALAEARRHQERAEAEARMLWHACGQSPTSVVIADTRGIIQYVNARFTDITGYTSEEAVGQNTRLLKSGRQTPDTYRDLWETITSDGSGPVRSATARRAASTSGGRCRSLPSRTPWDGSPTSWG